MNIEENYSLALTGKGTLLIDEVELKDLVFKAKSEGRMIGALEVYRVEGDMEIPCVEYGIYGGEIDPEIEHLSEVERIAFLENELNKTLILLKGDPGDYRFVVWFVSASG